jgi:hypothetical protein
MKPLLAWGSAGRAMSGSRGGAAWFHLGRTGAMPHPGLADSFISLSVGALPAAPGPNPFRSVLPLPVHDTHRLSAHTERA